MKWNIDHVAIQLAKHASAKAALRMVVARNVARYAVGTYAYYLSKNKMIG